MKTLIKILAGSIIFVGLPIISWGVLDTNSFFANDIRLAYSIIIILYQVILVIRYPQIGSNRGSGKTVIKRQHFVVLLLQTIPLLILVLSSYSDSINRFTISDSNLIRLIGLVIFFVGFTLSNWSEIILGKQFSVEVTIQENHNLIMHGPFKYIRHPRYLGIILFTIGVNFIFNSWLGLLLVILLVATLLWRIHDEEKLMYREFAEKWDIYKTSTWKLIPYIY